jgi:hypothetical protein
LRREHEALAYLEPWAEALAIPRVFFWEDDPCQCCLIRSGLQGEADSVALPVTSPQEVLDRHFRKPLDWLGRFQSLAPPPEAISVRSLCESVLERLSGSGLTGLAAAIDKGMPEAGRGAISVHGDFFPRNVLLSSACVGVVDWDRFGAGLPLQDLFYLFVGADFFHDHRLCTLAEIGRYALFSSLPLCRYVMRRIELAGVSSREAACYFYCYLAAHLLEECLDRSWIWFVLLGWLEAAGFPAPGTSLPRDSR